MSRGGEQGQGLGYVLVVGAVLLVFVIAIVDLLVSEARWLIGSQRRGQVLQAADAALDRALYVLQRGSNWEAVPVANYDRDFTYTDIPGIRYTIRIQKGNWTPYAPAMGPETAYTPANVDMERTITVWATYTATGERRKVQGIAVKATLNSALYAEGTIAMGGSTDVYWGPVVSYDTGPKAIALTAGGQCSVKSHPIFIAKGGIDLNGQEAQPCGKDSPDPFAGVSVDSYSTALGDPPKVPIDDYRNRAKALDKITPSLAGPAPKRYYFSGQALWSFTSIPGSGAWPDFMTNEGDPTVVFFDTVDGLPYKGTNGTTVRLSGGNNCGAGVLVVMGVLDVQGSGNCAAVKAVPPPDCLKLGGPCTPNPYTISGHVWDGFVWAQNRLDAAGTKKFYGSVGATNGVGTGNLEIWYKSGNKSLGYLGQRVAVRYWRERKPEPWDVFP
jgi:hypothetical protein